MKVQLLVQCYRKATVDGYNESDSTVELQFGTIYPSPNDGELAEEVKRFFKATPSSEIKFSTINPSAAAEFKLGKKYRLTLEAVE